MTFGEKAGVGCSRDRALERDEGENVYEAQRAKHLICDTTAFPFILQVMIRY